MKVTGRAEEARLHGTRPVPACRQGVAASNDSAAAGSPSEAVASIQSSRRRSTRTPGSASSDDRTVRRTDRRGGDPIDARTRLPLERDVRARLIGAEPDAAGKDHRDAAFVKHAHV